MIPFTPASSVNPSSGPSSFGQSSNSNVFASAPLCFGPLLTNGTSAQGIPSASIGGGGSSSGLLSSTCSPYFGQMSNFNGSSPTNCASSMAATTVRPNPFGSVRSNPFASVRPNPFASQTPFGCNTSPHSIRFGSDDFSYTAPLGPPGQQFSSTNYGVSSPFPSGPKQTSSSLTDRSKTDASASKESKHEQKLQSEEMEKSVQLICKDVLRHEEDMKRWIERYRSLELEKMEDTETIKQLREELADQVAKSKDAIIAEYLESPAFTKRLDEEHQKRLSEIFHPCYVRAVRSVQTKSPDTDTWEMVNPENSPGGLNYH